MDQKLPAKSTFPQSGSVSPAATPTTTSAERNDEAESNVAAVSRDEDPISTSFRLNSSVLEEAQVKIREAEAHRAASKIRPKQLIPVVEGLLPPDMTLQEFEDKVEKKANRVAEMWHGCLEGCYGQEEGGGHAHQEDDLPRTKHAGG